MNSFDKKFFKKYIPKGQKISHIFHRHWIKVIDDIIIAIGLGVLIPVFMYYNSELIQQYIEFRFFEIYLFGVYIVIIYKIFDWYCDVLILTQESITRLEWSLLKSSSSSVEYQHVEGVEINKKGLLDKILLKGDIKILKFGEEKMSFDQSNKPYLIKNKIEEITSKIEPKKELTKFELMMEALGGIVEDYVGLKGIKKEDNQEDNNEEEIKINKKFLEEIQKNNETIDLR